MKSDDDMMKSDEARVREEFEKQFGKRPRAGIEWIQQWERKRNHAPMV